jgi:hypothetical protein
MQNNRKFLVYHYLVVISSRIELVNRRKQQDKPRDLLLGRSRPSLAPLARHWRLFQKPGAHGQSFGAQSKKHFALNMDGERSDKEVSKEKVAFSGDKVTYEILA